jgi:hypothetical protein
LHLVDLALLALLDAARQVAQLGPGLAKVIILPSPVPKLLTRTTMITLIIFGAR